LKEANISFIVLSESPSKDSDSGKAFGAKQTIIIRSIIISDKTVKRG